MVKRMDKIIILDQVPLANLPQTGSNYRLLVLAALLGLLAVMCLTAALSDKQKKARRR